jgi:hypothetical protein
MSKSKSKSKSDYIFIVFQRIKALEILRYTNLELIKAGDIWMEAYASEADIETFKLNGWNYWTN